VGEHGEVGAGHMEDRVSCVPVIVERCMEGWLDWVGLCRWEEDWLIGLCAQVRLEPACKLPHKGILERVVVFLVGVAVGDRGDGALQV
jgi:hypothetical protein